MSSNMGKLVSIPAFFGYAVNNFLQSFEIMQTWRCLGSQNVRLFSSSSFSSGILEYVALRHLCA